MQALIWNAGYVLFVTVVTSWWLGITFGNAAYFAVITFTTVGLGDFAPPSRPASLRVDGVGVDAAMRAGSYTTTRRMRTWSANTSFSRRRRCWVSCC